MASGTLDADETRERRRWGENSKVYTRKKFKKNNNDDKNNRSPVPQQASHALANEDPNSFQQQKTLSPLDAVSNGDPQVVAAPNGCEPSSGDKAIKPIITKVENRVVINLGAGRSRKDIRELKRKLVDELDQVRSSVKKLEAKEVQLVGYSTAPDTAAAGGGYSHSQYPEDDGRALARVNSELGYSANDGRALARVNSELGYSANDGRALARVNSAVGYSAKDGRALKRVNSEVGYLVNDGRALARMNSKVGYSAKDGRALARVNSEVGSVGDHDSRPFQRLRVSVMENNHGFGEFVEKEKRTPKANPYYRNTEFLLGKERLPLAESNKKLKTNGGRKHGGKMGYGFGINRYIIQALKSCNNLLTRLMKHKHGWVFNEPVDPKALGLHDYHDIIKHPMDLGTVKSKLGKNWYKSPREFAEDVRLTFHNAMTYNPKGQDVHVMAEELLKIFEEKWTVIESGYSLDWRFELVHDLALLSPTSRKIHPPPSGPPPPLTIDMRTLERAASMTIPLDSKRKPKTPVARTPVPKKPKANDPHKRDMTYDEKQRLSTNLQGLPSEKLDSIVQIIKKRSSALSQRDDEIEVDIDSVDAETLWELDRFVTNYKKSLSKNKRRAELALQARAGATAAAPATNPAPGGVDAPKESKTDQNNGATSSPAQGERPGDNVSGSSSSSSSSSDSDSSSSDSDSDSSSANGSDAGHSSGT